MDSFEIIFSLKKFKKGFFNQKKSWKKRGNSKFLNCKNVILIQSYNSQKISINGILLPKLFWPTVREKCSSDREKLLKFEAEGQDFAKILRSLEQLVRTVKGQNNFW